MLTEALMNGGRGLIAAVPIAPAMTSKKFRKRRRNLLIVSIKTESQIRRSVARQRGEEIRRGSKLISTEKEDSTERGSSEGRGRALSEARSEDDATVE